MTSTSLRVGIIRGGSGEASQVSLSSGSAIIQSINEHLSHKYYSHDIFIDKHGNWYFDGKPVSLANLHSKIDLVINGLHGNFGENGKIQSMLEWHGIPFTGSGSAGSAVTANKILTKSLLDSHGIKNPYGVVIDSAEILKDSNVIVSELFKKFMLPAIVKPSDSSSSLGVSLVNFYEDFDSALKKATNHSRSVIIEEYIKGTEVTCGVIENFRSNKFYALPPVEVVGDGLYDFHTKYSKQDNERVPASLSLDTKKELENLAIKIHEILGLRHYSRTDFVVHPRRGIYVIEVNTAPDLSKESLFSKALRSVGSDLHHFIEHVVDLVKGR